MARFELSFLTVRFLFLSHPDRSHALRLDFGRARDDFHPLIFLDGLTSGQMKVRWCFWRFWQLVKWNCPLFSSKIEPGSGSARGRLFVSIGHFLFAHQSFISSRSSRSNLLFSVVRLLSSWSSCLSFLSVVYLQSIRRNYAYPLVPSVEVL